MAVWDLGELARAAEAEIVGGALGVSVEAVGTDSRSLPPASLFVALRGERFDGHAFVATAVQAGARAVLVDAGGYGSLPHLDVPVLVARDTLHALGDVACFIRRRHAAPVVAVTGSNGKTTTKELVAAALSQQGEVHKTSGNLNNLIGVPLTLFAWPDSAWAAVVEMGMNAPGEIERLTEITVPNVGIVTNVAAAHLAGLGSIEAVARAKGELYAGLGPDAVAVLNADDPMVQQIGAPLVTAGRHLRFGRGKDCDVRLAACTPSATGLEVRLEIGGTATDVQLPLVGEHNALNAAAAAAAAYSLGLNAEQIAAGLATVKVPGSRLRLLRDVAATGAAGSPRLSIVDDSYNANPASMRAAFAALRDLAGPARRVAVLGDMLELGPKSPELHDAVGRAAAESGIAWVLALGEQAPAVAEAVRRGGSEARVYSDMASLQQDLVAGVRPGDWLLIKGSRGMRMERALAALTGGEG